MLHRNDRRLFPFILVFLGLISVGCTKNRNLNEKLVKISVAMDIKGMDPIYSNDLYSSTEVARVYEGLLEYNYLKRPYSLAPNLASAMPEVSEDGLTYTFKLRPDVYFTDDVAFPQGKGRKMVAEDFVYSLKRLADPKLQGLGWWVFDGKIKGLNEWRDSNSSKNSVDYAEEVEGLKALDEHTLQFKLNKPFPQFLYGLAMPFSFVVAKEVVEHYGPEFLNHPVGTGPFVLPEFHQSKKIVYTRNTKFRTKLFPSEGDPKYAHILKEYAGKPVPFVDKIVVEVMIESQPRFLKFKSGDLDYLSPDKDNFDSIVANGNELTPEFKNMGVELEISPSLDVTYVGFNLDKTLFKNVNLRRAMALAYDVDEVNRLFFNNTALPAQSIIPPGIAGNEPSFVSPYRKRNIEEAKKLLSAAGYPNGKGLPEISYECPNGTTSRQMGELFQKQMADIGIKINVQVNSWPELQRKINDRKMDLYGIAWSADYPDAENFLQLLYGPNRAPGANGSGFNDTTFNETFAKASVMQDGPDRTKLYQKLNRMAADQVPLIFSLHRQEYLLKQSWLKNMIATDFPHGIVQYLDIDLEAKAKFFNQTEGSK